MSKYEGFVRVVAPSEAQARLIAASAMHLASDRIDKITDAGPASIPGCREFHLFTK